MWLGTRRRRLALALLVVLLAVRVVLPPIVRSVLVSRVNAALDPYVMQAAGYSIGAGAASFACTVRWTVRNLASRGERTAIRDALTARARGGTADLALAQQARLDTWVAEKAIADDQLGRLAAARAEELRTVLGKNYGVDAARVAIGDPEVDREHGSTAVGVSLAAGS